MHIYGKPENTYVFLCTSIGNKHNKTNALHQWATRKTNAFECTSMENHKKNIVVFYVHLWNTNETNVF